MIDPVVIASYSRTPIGSFRGAFSLVTATDLGTAAAKAAINRAKLSSDAVERIYMGCVLSAGLRQAPARQVALGAGLCEATGATTLNKMCGSGMQAVIMACEALAASSVDVMLAGGMESMSNAPYALLKHRSGARIGHDSIFDTMMMDGLEDAYAPGKAMGCFAEEAAEAFGITRKEQDDYAIQSLDRALAATKNGAFNREIAPVLIDAPAGQVEISIDEQPGRARREKIPLLSAAFVPGGTVTAANASSISDGAAALVLTRRSIAEQRSMPIIARLLGHSAHAQAPSLFTTAPAPAIRKLLDKVGWSTGDVDLYEVNEAFAVVALIAARDLGIAAEKLNVNGGATALGHPIGASGARIIATLLGALEDRNLKRGVAALCIGGGEATAIAVERE